MEGNLGKWSNFVPICWLTGLTIQQPWNTSCRQQSTASPRAWYMVHVDILHLVLPLLGAHLWHTEPYHLHITIMDGVVLIYLAFRFFFCGSCILNFSTFYCRCMMGSRVGLEPLHNPIPKWQPPSPLLANKKQKGLLYKCIFHQRQYPDCTSMLLLAELALFFRFLVKCWLHKLKVSGITIFGVRQH